MLNYSYLTIYQKALQGFLKTMRNLKIYDLNGVYKVVSLPINNQKFYNNKINVTDYVNKRDNNLIRARSTIKDLILCNDFTYFFTLTFDPCFNSFDLDDIRKRVTTYIRVLRSKHKELKLDYILIPEKHKSGRWHLHGVLSSDFSYFIYINQNGFDSLSCFSYYGFNSLDQIKDKNKVSSYITKYVSKDFKDRKKGSHLYFCSRGLNRPRLIHDYVYSNSYFDFNYFDYKSDFAYVNYSNNYNFITLLNLY